MSTDNVTPIRPGAGESATPRLEDILISVEANRLHLRHVAGVLECARIEADHVLAAVSIKGAISIAIETLDRIDEELMEEALLKNAVAIGKSD